MIPFRERVLNSWERRAQAEKFRQATIITGPVSVPENPPEPEAPSPESRQVDKCMRQGISEGRCKIDVDGVLVLCARHRFEAADSDSRVGSFLQCNSEAGGAPQPNWMKDDWHRQGQSMGTAGVRRFQ